MVFVLIENELKKFRFPLSFFDKLFLFYLIVSIRPKGLLSINFI
jgi:hypothetical protein